MLARKGALARTAGADEDDEAELGDLEGHWSMPRGRARVIFKACLLRIRRRMATRSSVDRVFCSPEGATVHSQGAQAPGRCSICCCLVAPEGRPTGSGL